MKFRHLIPVTLVLPLVLAGCGIVDFGEDDENTFEAEGVVRFVEVEGGCWTIVTQDETYEPVDLPVGFKIDGLEVEFEAEIRTDLASICQVGIIIDLEEIKLSDR
jgi:hypothetical protein